jgi:methylated-DNA-[protein]-cysteine S-methyltransferase
MTTVSTVETPIGPFSVIVDGEGSVLASGWTTDATTLLTLVHPDLRGDPRRRPDVGAATRAVRAYLDGDLTAPDEVPVRQHTNGIFLPAAWAALRKVAPGEPISYTEFAALAGRPAAIRAAAQACARNAAALFVPCHRVIRGDGSLGGFRWGLDTKRWLLAHESAS